MFCFESGNIDAVLDERVDGDVISHGALANRVLASGVSGEEVQQAFKRARFITASRGSYAARQIGRGTPLCAVEN
jgi:hypothetical protein